MRVHPADFVRTTSESRTVLSDVAAATTGDTGDGQPATAAGSLASLLDFAESKNLDLDANIDRNLRIFSDLLGEFAAPAASPNDTSRGPTVGGADPTEVSIKASLTPVRSVGHNATLYPDLVTLLNDLDSDLREGRPVDG